MNQFHENETKIRPFFIPFILGVGCLAVFGLFSLKERMKKGEPEAPVVVSAESNATPKGLVSLNRKPSSEPTAPLAPPAEPVQEAVPALASPAVQPPPVAVPQVPVPAVASAETRQMVESLMFMNPDGAPLTQEQSEAWKQNLQSLIQQGAAGIPAIRDFLETSSDLMFDPATAQTLGYDSVRGAMFDALRQIGGAEGIQGLVEALRMTGDPREVLTLARDLESMAPGEHRQEMLESARQVLAMAGRGELADYDVGPLFEVFQKYGESAALPDLEEALGKWKYYGAIGLANLPEGAGIPSLIQLASGSSGQRGIALEMLAQVSLDYPEARAALLDQVRAGKVSPNQWPYLSSVLRGDYYQLPDALWLAAQNGAPVDRQKTAHIAYGNQNFYQGPPPGGVSPDQLAQQIALVDEIAGATADPAANQALQAAKGVLNQRLNRLTAVPLDANQNP